MKKVIIYPGRFQPMLSHHAQVFDQLGALYNDADVYIVTSDKVEPGKSPFNFEEKKKIIASHGIDPSKILYARSPYNWEEIAQYVSDVENTVIYFAVGEKDMESNPRFRFDNIDDKGINQKIKGGATYYQMINTYKDEPLPMNQRGYILKVPTISTDEEVASASAFRKAISVAPDKESAKLIFNKQFKQFDNNVFELVYNKLKGDKMSEDLNIMKKLAGLEVTEGAPIEFEDQVSVKDINFAEVSKSSSKLSIANRFPEGSDVNDMETKKDMYVKELMKSPVALLSEINERIMPDENGLAVSTKLNKIIDGMREKGIADLEAEDKGFVMDLVKHSLKNMDLEAGDNREFDPESGALESIELDDIRSDYDIQEEEGEVEEMYDKPENRVYSKRPVPKNEYTYDTDGPDLVITAPVRRDREGNLVTGETRVIKDFTYFDEEPSQKELRSFFKTGMSSRDAEDDYYKRTIDFNRPNSMDQIREVDMDEGKVKDMAMDQADAFYDKVSSIADETNDIQKAIVDSWTDEEENPPVWALDSAAQDILTDAGLIQPESDEADLEEAENEELNDLRQRAGLPVEEAEEDLESKLKTAITGTQYSIQGYEETKAEIEADPEFQKADDDEKDDWMWDATDGVNIQDALDMLDYWKSALADHQKNGTTHWWQSEFVSVDTAVRDDIAQELRDMGAWKGDLEEAVEGKNQEAEESFDPAMEPTKKEQIMSNMADGDFETAGALLGADGPSVMQDWGEFCSERGLDQKDALEDIDHIENFVDEEVNAADDKYYPAESIEEQESAVVGKALDSAMVELKKLAGLY
tara:strand:- start:5259 stop:7691 length:2433 start_codon:yes stop_codon:yes gene_type:complete